MKILHLVYIPVTGLGIKEYGGDEWFKYRLGIFHNYTLRSLANQSIRDFVVWLSFRKEEKNNPVAKAFEEYLLHEGIQTVSTFDGIMMHDDRGTWHNEDLEQRMSRSLEVIKGLFRPTDWVFKTDLGSDDMFSREALAEIQQEKPRERGATYYLNGYILNMQTGQVADWLRDSSCSKYTVMYPYETFFDAKLHLEYIKGLVSHEFVPLVFDATRLPDGRYMCGVHQANISTTWNNNFRGREYLRDEKLKILKNFGL
jgi:hypothetical protein